MVLSIFFSFDPWNFDDKNFHGWRWEIKEKIKSTSYSTPPSSILPSSHLSRQLAVALHSRQAAGIHINNNNDFSCWAHRLGI